MLRIQVSTIREEEYKCLIEEHQKNRVYAFERPILIFGIVVAAIQYLSLNVIPTNVQEIEGFRAIQLIFLSVIPVIIIGILYFNMLFVADRLYSDARIVSYIQLFHEGILSKNWIGWESSLRFYRKWIKHHPQKARELEEKISRDGIYHIFSYPYIFLFHLILVFLVYLMWMVEIISIVNAFYSISLVSLTFVLLIVIFMLFIWEFRRKFYLINLKNVIEHERAKWFIIYRSYKKSWTR